MFVFIEYQQSSLTSLILINLNACMRKNGTLGRSCPGYMYQDIIAE